MPQQLVMRTFVIPSSFCMESVVFGAFPEKRVVASMELAEGFEPPTS